MTTYAPPSRFVSGCFPTRPDFPVQEITEIEEIATMNDADQLRTLSGCFRSQGNPIMADSLRQIADRMEVEAKVADVGRKLATMVIVRCDLGYPIGYHRNQRRPDRLDQETVIAWLNDYCGLDPSAILAALEPAK